MGSDSTGRSGEINARLYGPTLPSEILNVLIFATLSLTHRFHRYPTPTELMMGMLISDTETAMLTCMADELSGAGR